jgi:hypothetical protein
MIQINTMLLKTVHIEKPSPQLLNLVRKLQAEKEENKKRLVSKKDDFFKKK